MSEPDPTNETKPVDPKSPAVTKAGEPTVVSAFGPSGDFDLQGKREIGGPQGPEPTRFGDWERKGRCIDF